MGVEITSISAVGFLFKDYKIVEKESEEVRFDSITGVKNTNKIVYKSYECDKQIFEGSYDFEMFLQGKFGGLAVFFLGEDWKDPIYIGQSLSALDAKRGDLPKIITFSRLKEVSDHIKWKAEQVGKEVEPVLLHYLHIG